MGILVSGLAVLGLGIWAMSGEMDYDHKSSEPNASVSIPGGEPGYDPRKCSGDQILFSERRKIAEQADSIMRTHNIARDTFGVMCALSIIGSLKRPNADPHVSDVSAANKG